MYSIGMQAEVLTLYLRGESLGKPRMRDRGVAGDLISQRLKHRTVLILEDHHRRAALKLYKPQFLMADMAGLYLDGFETVDGVSYRQCWLIRWPAAAVRAEKPPMMRVD